MTALRLGGSGRSRKHSAGLGSCESLGTDDESLAISKCGFSPSRFPQNLNAEARVLFARLLG
jgi:hypothetical protein